MSSAHRRYLLLEHGLGAAATNFIINAVIAWLTFRGVARVPLWGYQSIAGDTIGTSLLLALLGVAEMPHGSFIVFKAAFAAALAALVTPVIALSAIANPPSRLEATAGERRDA